MNKYVAHCGVASRRKAVELIQSGEISVNGEVEKTPYRLITSKDEVKYKGQIIKPVQEEVYILLNKPKGVICSMKDEKGRKTVADILEEYKEQNIHYVGRLDRDTTGLLLLTNDGDLTHKLTHPSSEVTKIYAVGLDRPMTKKHLEQLKSGIHLEDGFIQPDAIDYDRSKGKNALGITLHSGRNRIIRRMMEHFDYEVVTLDRVYFAGLTKKDLPRGWHRELKPQEVIRLKHFKT